LIFFSEQDGQFTDISHSKGTNGYVRIQRANSPVKAKKELTSDTPQPTHLPRVANKYVLGNRKVMSPNVLPNTQDVKPDQNVTKPKTEQKQDENTSKHNGKLSASETTDIDEEEFRPRASTFPGKVQRPVTTIQKLMTERGNIDQSDRSEGPVKTRVYRTKTDPSSNSKKEIMDNRLSSPVCRRESPFQKEGFRSPTPRHTGNPPILLQYRKNPAAQRRETSKDSIQEEDISISSGKHILSRPSRTNKFYRISTGNHTARDDTVVNEQVTEISSAQPNSARNATVNFRSATPVLPSLSVNTENGKRNQ
jgi:hypothetical protein